MAAPLTREQFETPQGRARAWRELMLADHGLIRLLYRNTHEIAPGRMWRTYQPSPRHLEALARRGVKTIVNLRGDKPSGFYFLEEEACRRLGLDFITFRVFSREAPSKETLRDARALFDRIRYPAAMHCKSGADRVGLMSTLYLFFREGAPLDKAMQQLSFRYGHIRHGKTGVIDHALEQYIEHARREGTNLSSPDHFMRWVDTVYDPGAAKQAFLGSWWGNLLTEKILRRE
ncbi:MAG: protein tyrosine phosphatase [Pseudomonadota bacterium]|nr:protein tyrosine phosphatase [Pseudomonadota bacterium]